MMKKVDDDVADVMNLLKELQIDDDTIVLFTSDNGPHKEGGHDPDFFDSNGPLTGYKRDLTEGGIRTFLMARWPGKIAPGSSSDHVSAHWDMLPTFCDIAGIDAPQNIDGISMLPTLTNSGNQNKHDHLYWEFYEKGGRKAARWGNWKAIQNNVKTNNPGPIEIYDLSSDLAEQNDLASSKPELVERAKSIFKEAHTPSPNWTWKPVPKKKKKVNQKKKTV
jgi:arylsulfatase A-like enzyme